MIINLLSVSTLLRKTLRGQILKQFSEIAFCYPETRKTIRDQIMLSRDWKIFQIPNFVIQILENFLETKLHYLETGKSCRD